MSTHKIAIVAMQGVQLLDVIGPSDVFAEANRQSGLGYYSVEVVSTSGSPVRGSSGLALIPDRLIDEEPSEVDTLLVAGDPLIQERPLTENLLRWVKQASAKANRVGSVCSGAFVLGEAGLLTGKRATTHWSQASEFARRFPDVKLEPNRIFTKDGNVWTSAGVTAGIDLALAIVEQDLGLGLPSESLESSWCFSNGPADRHSSARSLPGRLPRKRRFVLPRTSSPTTSPPTSPWRPWRSAWE
ncbi:AraC family transcriptional regulator [Sinorhizobium meliloti]